jgi:histidinol-phosphate phosphatase family protein
MRLATTLPEDKAPPTWGNSCPAVLFDRDATLTRDRGYTHKVEDLELLPGALEAVRACNEANVLVVIVTNQAGLARGKYEVEHLKAFHSAMLAMLAKGGARVDAFYFCPFHEEGTVASYTLANHPDRKPNSGMVRRALLELNFDASRSFMVGDRDVDVVAAQGAGLQGRLSVMSLCVLWFAYFVVVFELLTELHSKRFSSGGRGAPVDSAARTC